MSELSSIRIVLVETSHPGNIGAAARAMKTMGLSELVLVRPRDYPCVEATARAAGADDVLAAARVVDDLPAALDDCQLAFGATARLRSLRWPVVTAREAAAIAIDELDRSKIAIVFGRERTGLSNDELALCQQLLNIPVNPDFSSLNLSAAVQVVCYELRLAALGDQPRQTTQPEEEYAPAGMIDSFHAQLEKDLVEIGFLDPDNPRQLPLKLRRLFIKARPTINEIKILRGILKGLSRKRNDSEAGAE